jgi:hypothetical protein
MEKSYAYINKNSSLIENIIVCDDENPYAPPDGIELVEIPTEGVRGEWSSLGIGWTYQNGVFVEPTNPDPDWKPEYKSIVGDVPNVIA